MRNKRRVLLVVAGILTPLIIFGLYWFAPWRLFTTTVVDEALPDVAVVIASAPLHPTTAQLPAVPRSSPTAPTTPTTTPPIASSPAPTAPKSVVVRPTPATPTPTPTQATTAKPAAPSSARPQAVLLAQGTLISHEHHTSGTVGLVRLADGRRVLTLKGLQTSDGPDLHVWITDAPVQAGEEGWRVFDDGRHLDLGSLKGNVGNQVYPIGDDVDLSQYTSVSIWCERFSVSFGAAELGRI